jgi:hypothetical protein
MELSGLGCCRRVPHWFYDRRTPLPSFTCLRLLCLVSLGAHGREVVRRRHRCSGRAGVGDLDRLQWFAGLCHLVLLLTGVLIVCLPARHSWACESSAPGGIFPVYFWLDAHLLLVTGARCLCQPKRMAEGLNLGRALRGCYEAMDAPVDTRIGAVAIHFCTAAFTSFLTSRWHDRSEGDGQPLTGVSTALAHGAARRRCLPTHPLPSTCTLSLQ